MCRRRQNPEQVMNWLRLAKYLGPFWESSAPRGLSKVPNLHLLEEAIRLAHGVASILADWPANFEVLLDRCRRDRPGVTHLAEAYGPLYGVLYKKLAGAAFDELRRIFEQHLHTHWFGLLGRRNRRLGAATIARHPQRTTNSLARESGVGNSAVRQLALHGRIASRAIEHPSGRTSIAVPNEEVARVVALKGDSLTLRQATLILGICQRRVRQLIDAGMLNAWIDRRAANSGRWWISKADILRLASVADRNPLVRGDQRGVQVAAVLKGWALKGDEAIALLRCIASRQIRAYRAQAKGLGGAVLDADELREWLEWFRSAGTEWLSVDAAARRLGIKQQVAYQLVSRGLVGSRSEGGARRVHVSDVEAFRCKYVSLAELAVRRHTSPRSLLAAVNARPVCGPSVDGARQYFFLREDLACPAG
jgi:hypothetical protein